MACPKKHQPTNASADWDALKKSKRDYSGIDAFVKQETIAKMRGLINKGASGSEIVVFPNVDHGFNASTFAARVCAATLSDVHSAIVAGIVFAAVNVLLTGILDVEEEGSVYQNLIERLVILKGEGTIGLDDIQDRYMDPGPDVASPTLSLPSEGICFRTAVSRFENELITQALQRTHGNKNKAADLLRLNRTTLVEKIKRRRLESEE